MWVGEMAQWIVALWNAILTAVRGQLTAFDPRNWEGGGGSAPWEMAGAIQETVLSVGMGLALIFWAVSFFRYVEDFHRIDMREAAGWILRLALILVIMNETMMIMELFLDVALEVNAAVLQAAPLDGGALEVPRELLDAVQTVNTSGNVLEVILAFFESLPVSLLYFLLLAVILCCGIVVMVVLFLRYFKLYLYAAVAPLPLSTLAGSETAEIGRHFLKSWAGACLEVCIISIAVLIFMASMTGPGSDNILPFLGDGAAAGDGSWSDVSGAANLWSVSLNWAVAVLIKSILLVSVIKGADRITEKITGT